MTNHTAHTPAPWRVSRDPAGMIAEVQSQTGIVLSSLYIVADGVPATTTNAEADARLLAAAPTLLAALRQAREALEMAQNELARAADSDRETRKRVGHAEQAALAAIREAIPSAPEVAAERVKTKRAARAKAAEAQTPVSGSAAIQYRRPAGGELFTTEGAP